MVDQTIDQSALDQTVDNDVQIDSSSPPKQGFYSSPPKNDVDEKWSQPFKWGDNDMAFDYLDPADL